ncbi:uncharacterized protein [Panulirus ornatus]|uniref:uncharacterized protein n=1 Tax=Panulirus ornatus TaxID=150431 RepID=UPI003A83E28B
MEKTKRPECLVQPYIRHGVVTTQGFVSSNLAQVLTNEQPENRCIRDIMLVCRTCCVKKMLPCSSMMFISTARGAGYLVDIQYGGTQFPSNFRVLALGLLGRGS